MNTKEYIALLNRPYSVTEKQTDELERILAEFPFLQSARAVTLKVLYNKDSFRYNTELKKTAAYTTDRAVLFDFITSEQFQSIEKKSFEDKEKAVADITVKDSEEIIHEPKAAQVPVNKLEESIKQTIKKAAQEAPEEKKEANPATGNPTEEKLEIGKPLGFTGSEKHSFSEWLQLSKLTPIQRETPTEKTADDSSLDRKMELIDRFIESSPKIIPNKNSTPSPATIEASTRDNSSLMTETLARVYLEQKKYSKAIQAYEILILKYPEKSVFFADRIEDIKLLQQNNNF